MKKFSFLLVVCFVLAACAKDNKKPPQFTLEQKMELLKTQRDINQTYAQLQPLQIKFDALQRQLREMVTKDIPGFDFSKYHIDDDTREVTEIPPAPPQA